MSSIELSDQEIQRREKLGKLRELGINPYPADLFPVTDYSIQSNRNLKKVKKFVLRVE